MDRLDLNINRYTPLIAEYGIRLVGALILIIVAFWLSGKLQKVVLKSMSKARVDVTLAKFGSDVAKWALLVMAGISLLGVFGIQTASFAAVIAALGLAIGMAFQGTLSNLAAGVMLLIFRPFKVGQFITVSGIAGTVEEIEIFTTSIDTPDNRRIIVPNSKIFGATIENVSYHAERRLDVELTVDQALNIDATRNALLAATQGINQILAYPAPVAELTTLTPTTVQWVVRVWVKAADFGSAKEALLESLKTHLDAAKAEAAKGQTLASV